MRAWAILFVFLAMFLTINANAVELKQKMDVEIGVFDAAEVVLSYTDNADRFSIRADVNTANVFDTFYPFQARYESLGKVWGNGKVLPEVYQTRTKSRNHVRTKQILYDVKGKAYKRISAKDKKENVVAIKNLPVTVDVSDLQTVFAELIKNIELKRRCALVREVHDGKKHYMVIAKDAEAETRYFEGLNRTENAYKCSIYIENLKENNDNILWDVSADKPINVWIGIEPKTKFPYLLEISIDSTPLGALKVRPRTLEIK